MAEEEFSINKKHRGGERKGKKNQVGRKVAFQDGAAPQGEDHLEGHKRPRGKGEETKKLIRIAMKSDRVCANFDEKEIDTILETMEYFEFAPGEAVVKQDCVGTTFFVTHSGSMEVSVNGNPVNSLSRGNAFGGLALLYNCPRTATITSSTSCAVWGANGETFHKVLQDNARAHYAENRKFVDAIGLFDGLAVRQKDQVGEAFFNEVFEAGERVVTQGEDATAMYYVKDGALRVVADAAINASGKVTGGRELSRIRGGEVFGERALLFNEKRTSTVVAEQRTEVLCISAEQLKEVLGHDLKACLEQNVIVASLKQSPIMSVFTQRQLTQIAKVFSVRDFEAGQALPVGMRFAVVVDREIQGKNSGTPVTLVRAEWYEQDACPMKDRKDGTPAAAPAKGTFTDIVAGTSGARVGVLTEQMLTEVLKELNLKLDSTDQVLAYSKKLALAKKVHIFRHLTQEQVDRVVSSFVAHRFERGKKVITQGEHEETFWVIAEGEVTVMKDGVRLRTLSNNAYFGERALLFSEARSASVEVSSRTADFFALEKTRFLEILSAKMKEELVSKIQLQDTSVTMKDLKHIKVIGAGAAGVVRLVEHKKTKTRYALKRVAKQDGKVPPDVQRECELLAENDHPFIMLLVKNFQTDKSVYMLTELITGGELHAAIRKVPTLLSRQQAQFYTGSLVLVLESIADRNIVYRDLKPENVMLDQQGYLKLIDFGIAKKLEEDKNKTFTMIGTPHYMAPEVMKGHGYGTEVDIWSLGVMLFEFVCGYLPFADDLDDPTEVCTAVLKDPLTFPADYKEKQGRTLLQALLSRNPKKRLGSGMGGYEDIKNAEYFKLGYSTPQGLFAKIMARELDAPVAPEQETYCNPDDVADIALSDADELG